MTRLVLRGLAAALVLAASACTTPTERLEQAMVRPDAVMAPAQEEATVRHYFCVDLEHVALGPGPQRLAFAIVPPHDYGFTAKTTLLGPEQGRVEFDRRHDCPTDRPPARGTVLLLHGYLMNMTSLWPWVANIAQAGYATLLVDLPGFGASTDYLPDYGAASAERVAQLVARLRAEHRLAEPLVVIGASLGGMEALRVTARVPDVRGVLAIAPVRDLEASSWSLVGTDAPAWVRWLVSRDDLRTAMRRAEGTLHAPLLAPHHEDAVGGSTACTVLARGDTDAVVTDADVVAYAARLPGAQVVRWPRLGHMGPLMRMDWLMPPILAWLDALAATPPGGACPRLALPPDPCCQGPGPAVAVDMPVGRRAPGAALPLPPVPSPPAPPPPPLPPPG